MTSPKPLKRICVDFNTLNSTPIDVVRFSERFTPPDLDLRDGELVTLYDGELEVDAFLHDHDGKNWMATPIPSTWRDVEQETPGVESLERWSAEYDLRHDTPAR